MAQLIIGAPSLGKEGANKRALGVFGKAAFPLAVAITNKMTITLSMPEAGGTFRPLETRTATFKNFDRLQRAVSSMEQVAKLNKVTALVELATQEDSEAESEDADSGDSGDSSGGGDGGESLTVDVVQDDEEAFIVELQGVSFEPLRNQVREDGTLTAGGLKTFEEAKAAADKKSDEQGG
ncbi:hypothetical protein L0636_00955 [Halomonas janggokensis]|uniref:Uncharacterized protein n=1 Tax=Vreelandella janggokensis TaxID=370767 RepID=A0ABT4IS04_9GAMM|nr:hypothetical protein [Halomonas janggokensis]MCZ0926456.1 hypothetical protein [Halomonas janggokensis]MCZ0928994.1 hypothetical protein [Halomonas janggokensis]